MVAAARADAVTPPRKILAIEGLRAWLAWAVVLAHVIQITGVDRTHGGWWATQFVASEAVKVFIIISGFVITGVVLQRRESWSRYITRRIFRIFPVYLVLLPIGALTMYLARDALDYMTWASLPSFRYDDTARETIASVEAAPFAHILPHIALLQGLVPDSTLLKSQTSFLGPAWSLSLEWQFYLIAPLLIWMLQRSVWVFPAVAFVVGLAILYRLGVFGRFDPPAFFPAYGYMFVIGIASRLVFDRLRDARFFQAATATAFAAGALLFMDAFAIAVWCAFYALLVGAPRKTSAPDRVAQGLVGVFLQSRVAVAMGARSYAVYLAHWPVTQALAYFLLPLGAFSQFEALAILIGPTFLLTFLSAEALHRWVERPMIRLGAAIAEGRALDLKRGGPVAAAPKA